MISKPQSLANLVEYQPESVVSRVLLRNGGGVITLFAFAKGEGLTEHMTPHDATVQVLEGEVDITIGDDRHTVRTGEVLHLPATVPHEVHGGAPFKMLLTLLKNT